MAYPDATSVACHVNSFQWPFWSDFGWGLHLRFLGLGLMGFSATCPGRSGNVSSLLSCLCACEGFKRIVALKHGVMWYTPLLTDGASSVNIITVILSPPSPPNKNKNTHSACTLIGTGKGVGKRDLSVGFGNVPAQKGR